MRALPVTNNSGQAYHTGGAAGETPWGLLGREVARTVENHQNLYAFGRDGVDEAVVQDNPLAESCQAEFRDHPAQKWHLRKGVPLTNQLTDDLLSGALRAVSKKDWMSRRLSSASCVQVTLKH